jgi:2-keto-4-pentenoate hydratase/2-oxohepta-3-ene-1,7-dioic acid hydratase in catechol pathway
LTFRFANVEGRSALVDSDGRWFDASRVSGGAIPVDPMDAWRRLDELHGAAGAITGTPPDGNLSDAHVRPPIPSPRSVFAVGLNYRSHADESMMKVPDSPLIFTKFPSCLAGPTDPVILGGATDDYEAELVVVIGRGGRNIRREDAWGHVGGLTAGQDISDRALQFAAEPPPFRSGQVP